MMAKAIGIGGVFIKYKHPNEMKTWFENTLGLTPNDYGVLFSFNGNSHPKAYLQLGTFPADSDYFGNDQQHIMLNFRVDDLVQLKLELIEKGVTICDEIESFEYGKFLHILDPEGNRIELWEPVDGAFDLEQQVDMR